MLLVINPKAGGGTALDRWHRIERDLPSRKDIEVEVLQDPGEMPSCVAQGIAAGHRTFVAGGGDGTVNALCNALLDTYVRGRVVGAIGLGSSNDFHKPFRSRCRGIPCRVDRERTHLQDVGRIVIGDPTGVRLVRYWVVNASIGITADANRRFNRETGFVGRLKRVSTGASIGVAALITVLSDRGHELTVTVDGRTLPERRFRNVAFVKNPNFAGCLRYDSAPELAGGCFHFHAVGPVSFSALLRILAGLASRRFATRPGTRFLEAATARIESPVPFAIEFDGEVLEGTSAEFSLIPEGLEVCT